MTEEATKTMVGERNGVDVDGLLAAIELCGDRPAMAQAEWRAENTWFSGPHNRSTMQGFSVLGREDDSRTTPFVIEADEPPVLLGQNRGANPVEHVLAGLLGCLTTTLAYYAAAEGIELESVRSRVEADLDLRGLLGVDETVRNGFKDVRVTFDIKAKASRERIEALMEIVRSRSAVLDIVMNPVPVTVRLGA